jgi:Methyltransferase domain
MRQLDVRDKLAELATPIPDWQVFRRLGDLTKLRHENGRFHPVNYESGLLLHALVRKYRPQRILEIGTGRGYGALCLASALEDGGLPGEVVTVDTRGYDEPQEWALDDGTGPRVASLSRRDVWERHVDERLRRRIVQVQGSSFEALRRLAEEGKGGFELVYIDGDHTYPVVRHDFYASVLLARPPFRILLDDYTPLSHLYGVRRLVDEEIAPAFEAEAIRTDGRWNPVPPESTDPVDQAQVLLDSERMARPLAEAFPLERVARIVRRHRRWPGALSRFDALRAAAGGWLRRR